MTKWPKRIEKYLILDSVINETESCFRSHPHSETIVYWTGIFDGNTAIVRSCIFPERFQENNRWGYTYVDFKTAFDIGKLVHKRKEFLMIQLHTHPFEAFHSPIDNRFPISHRVGFISIVVPFYGQLPLKDQSNWKVYQYKGEGKWRQLSQRQVERKFIIRHHGGKSYK